MKKLRNIVAPALVVALTLAACGGDDTASEAEEPATEEPAAEETATEDSVVVTQGSDLTFHMVTHSDDGPFWSVVKRGMDAACEDVGVNCVWLGSNNDPGVQVQMIEQAISEGSDGIASALASPDQLVGPLGQSGHARRTGVESGDEHERRGVREERGLLHGREFLPKAPTRR